MNKASWPQFPTGAYHCVASWGLCEFFFGLNTWCNQLFHWRGTGMHTGMPLRVFVDTHDRSALRCWQRRFVGVHSVHSLEKLGELRGCHTGYRDILDLNGNRGPWCSRWPRDLGTWFGYSNQFLLCFVSSPFFSLNYKPFHPAEWRTITGCFFFLYPLSSPSGGPWDVLVPPLVVRCDSGVHSARNWLQLVQLCWFSLVSHAEQSFRCAQRHPRETAAKQKPINQQRPWMKGSTADNTGHIP